MGSRVYSFFFRYAVALGSTVVSLLIDHNLDPVYHRPIFFLLLASVIFNTWFSGLGPGIVSLVLGLIGSVYFVLPPRFALVLELHDIVRGLIFVGTSVFIMIMARNRRRLLDEAMERQRSFQAQIEEREKAERSQGESEARYRTLFEENPLPTCVFDIHTLAFLAVNEAAVRHYGYSREEWLSMTLRDIRPAEDVELLVKKLQDIGVTSGNHGIWRHRKRDGTIIQVDVTSHLIRFQGRDARLVVYQDVTQRVTDEQLMRSLNDQLEKDVRERTRSLVEKHRQLRSLTLELGRAEDRERKRLASILHDDLAQMLAFAKMKVDRVKKNSGGDISLAAMTELKQLLDDSLTYTRSLMTDLRPPLLGDEDDLKAALTWVAERARRHGLIVHLTENGGPKLMDEEVLSITYKAVHELLWNVIKHARTGEAFISIGGTEERAEIVVEDRGKGFNVTARRRPSERSGFGLFNISERLLMIGGHLEVKSAPHQGTQAILRVPLKSASVQAFRQPPGIERRATVRTAPVDSVWEPPVRSRVRVLLVDDHQIIREGMRTAIEEQEDLMVVGEAADGQAAVRLARDTAPDVVLMDVNLPVLSGVEATREIKRERPDVFVIGISIHDSGHTARAMREAGASVYLSKGVPVDALCAAIRSSRGQDTGREIRA